MIYDFDIGYVVGGLGEVVKTKGGKIALDEFRDMLGGGLPSASIRYGYLSIVGAGVNVTFGASGELKITGSYGC